MTTWILGYLEPGASNEVPDPAQFFTLYRSHYGIMESRCFRVCSPIHRKREPG